MNIVYIIFALLFFGNLFTSYKLIRSDMYDKIQKTFQLLILWFIPLFGMLFVLFFLKDEFSNLNHENSSNGSNTTNYFDSSFSSGGD